MRRSYTLAVRERSCRRIERAIGCARDRIAGHVEESHEMAAVKVGINGFGRIGRLVFRALVEQGLLGKTARRRRRQRPRAGRQPRLPAEVRLDAGPVQRRRSTARSRRRRRRGRHAGRQRPRDQVPRRQGRPAGAAVEGARRRVRHRMHRPVHRGREGQGPHHRRREEGHHLRPGQGRGHHRRHGRQPREVRRRQAHTSSPTRAARRTAWPRSSTCCSRKASASRKG